MVRGHLRKIRHRRKKSNVTKGEQCHKTYLKKPYEPILAQDAICRLYHCTRNCWVVRPGAAGSFLRSVAENEAYQSSLELREDVFYIGTILFIFSISLSLYLYGYSTIRVWYIRLITFLSFFLNQKERSLFLFFSTASEGKHPSCKFYFFSSFKILCMFVVSLLDASSLSVEYRLTSRLLSAASFRRGTFLRKLKQTTNVASLK